MTLLATLEDFQRSQGLDPDPTDVAGLIALEGASGVVRSYCGQTFDLTEGEQITLDGSGTRALKLPQAPALAITTVVVTDWDDVDTTLTTADYVLDASPGILWRAWPEVWTAGHQNIAVTYDHGYVLPGQVGANLPEDIQLVTLQLAARFYSQATSGGQEISSEQIGTYQVTYASTGTSVGDLMPLERHILDRHRTVALV